MELGEGEAQICRLCGQCESIYIDIFGEEGTKRFLGLKIHKKINILIDEKDPLPKAICVQCLGKLEFVCDFQEECLRTQQAFRDHYNLPSLTEIADVKNEDTPSTSANNNNNDINKNLNSPNERRAKEHTEHVPKAATKNQRTLRSQNQTKESEDPAKHHESVIQHTSEAKCENPETVQQNSEATTPRWLRSRQSTEANEVTSDTPIANRLRSHNSTAIEINENGDKDPHIIQIPTSALNKLLSIVSNSPNIDVSVKESRNQGIDNEDISFTVELCKNESKDVAVVRARVFPDQGSCLVDKDIVDLLQNQNSAEVNGIINTIINSSVKNGNSIKSKDASEFEQKWQASQNPEELFRIDGEEIRVDDNVEHVVTNNQNGYSCKLCCKVYERKDKCMVHVKTHLGIKQYTCILCSAKFVCKSDVMKHIRCSHTNPRPIQCPKCPKRFKSKFYLMEHDNVHKGVRPYSCTDCGQSYHHKVSLQIHMKSHLPPQNLACEYCGKVFPYRTRLLSHIASVHLKNRRNFRCRFCYNLYSSLSVLNEHIKTRHATTYTCEVCSKTFKVASKYKAHVLQHSNPKPFVCNVCNNRYASKAFLNEHLLKHEGLRKHICQKCGARFAQASHLAAHRHVHGEKEHACPECGRKFNRRDNMKIKENDGLPQTICMRCCGTLEFLCDFYEQCHLTQQNLKASQNDIGKRVNENSDLESDKENTAPPVKRNTNALPFGQDKRFCLTENKASYCRNEAKQTESNCADTEDTVKLNNGNLYGEVSKNSQKNINNLKMVNLLAREADTSQKIIVRTSLKDLKCSENVNINQKVPVRRKRGRKSNLEKMREAVLANCLEENQIQSDLHDKYNETCTNQLNRVTNNAVMLIKPQVEETKKQIMAVDTSSNEDCMKENEVDNMVANKLIGSDSSNTGNQDNCVKNAENKSAKGKAISVIVKQEKGDVEINNLIKNNKNGAQMTTLVTEEIMRPESNKTDLASGHDLITSSVAETSDCNNKKVFREQNRVTVIQCSQSNEILNPKVIQRDSVEVIGQSTKSDLGGNLTDDTLSRKSSQGSSSETKKKDKFRRLSELISDEQKQIIETYYTVNMSVVNEKEVQRHITIVDKKNMRCNICGNLYVRMDKCQVHIWGHLQMKPYQCKACDFSTVTISNVRCHIRKSHLKIKPFACHICGKQYVTGVLLKEHLNSHTGARPYKCNICDYACSSRQILSYHSNIHKPVKDVSCEICGKKFYSKCRLRSHMTVHNKSKSVMCKLCSAYLSNAESLETHHRNVHAQVYECKICGKYVKSRKALHNHQNVHAAAKYKCTLCPNVYKSSQILKEHLLKHEGIRKYKCKVCGKNFGQQSHLAAHMAVHSKIRFHCPGCDKPFNRQDNMKIHTKRCKSFQANPELKNLLTKRERTISFNNASELTAELKNENISSSMTADTLKNKNDNVLLNKAQEEAPINLCKLDLNVSCIKKSDEKWDGDNIHEESAAAKSGQMEDTGLTPHNENTIVLENVLELGSY